MSMELESKATTTGKARDKSMSLVIIQGVGCVMSFLCVVAVRDYAKSDTELLLWTVGINAVLCFALLALHYKYAADAYEEIINHTSEFVNKVCFVDFAVMLPAYAVLDLVAIGLCIYRTGGSQQSIFTPLLLTVVPVMISLRETNRWKVFGAALGTVFVLWITLFHHTGTFIVAVDVSTGRPVSGYLYSYYIMTIACTLFPTAIYLCQPNDSKM